jgi:hypothetical protein
MTPARNKDWPAEDTVAGCEGRASADLARAAAMDTENGRLRMERSAKSWTERATLLEDEGGEAHLAKLRAEWKDGDDDEPA